MPRRCGDTDEPSERTVVLSHREYTSARRILRVLSRSADTASGRTRCFPRRAECSETNRSGRWPSGVYLTRETESSPESPPDAGTESSESSRPPRGCVHGCKSRLSFTLRVPATFICQAPERRYAPILGATPTPQPTPTFLALFTARASGRYCHSDRTAVETVRYRSYTDGHRQRTVAVRRRIRVARAASRRRRCARGSEVVSDCECTSARYAISVVSRRECPASGAARPPPEVARPGTNRSGSTAGGFGRTSALEVAGFGFSRRVRARPRSGRVRDRSSVRRRCSRYRSRAGRSRPWGRRS